MLGLSKRVCAQGADVGVGVGRDVGVGVGVGVGAGGVAGVVVGLDVCVGAGESIMGVRLLFPARATTHPAIIPGDKEHLVAGNSTLRVLRQVHNMILTDRNMVIPLRACHRN